MMSTREIYGHPSSRYEKLPYIEAINLRYDDAKAELHKLRLCRRQWNQKDFSRAKVLTEAMRFNKTLLDEMKFDKEKDNEKK
jgi:hypothetical protein